MMKYAQIRKMDISNGSGIGVSLFTQGCRRQCPGCHNPEQQDFSGGKDYVPQTKQQILDLIQPEYIKRLSILGGEPFERRNIEDLFDLLCAVKQNKPDIKIWLYTGYTLEELRKQHSEKKIWGATSNTLLAILFLVDVLVDGPFIQEQKDITLAFRGSKNQRLIDLPETFMDNGKIHLLKI